MMKNLKRVFWVMLFAGLLPASLTAQDQEDEEQKEGKEENAPEHRIGIKTNPISMLGGPFWLWYIPVTGEYRLSAEVVITPNMSAEGSFSYLSRSPLINLEDYTDNDVTSFSTNGFRIQGLYKVYILSFFTDHKAPKGLYAAPNLSFSRALIDGTFDDGSSSGEYAYQLNKTEFGLTVGYQLATEGGFTFDPFVRLNYKLFNNFYEVQLPGEEQTFFTSSDIDRVFFNDHIGPVIGFNVGWFF